MHLEVESETPYPYQACYCSICRKTAGGGGYTINLGADANTLEIEGKENLTVYHAKLYDRGGPGEVPIGEVERYFCKLCGSFLWVYDPRWPDLVHLFASAVDTPCRSHRSGYTPRWNSPHHGALSPRARTSGTSPCGPESP